MGRSMKTNFLTERRGINRERNESTQQRRHSVSTSNDHDVKNVINSTKEGSR